MKIAKVKIYGERNTGTNYLNKLVDLNFKCHLLSGTVPKNINKIISRLNKDEFYRDMFFELTLKNNLGWKHREIDNDFLENMLKPVDDVKFITITKNPYSWLLSLYKNPYHINKGKDLSFSSFLETPWTTVNRETNVKEYLNPVEMWNIKNKSYLNLESNFNAILLRYEDLLQDSFFELKKIKEQFHLITKNSFPSNFVQSTKDKEKNNNYYKDYYGNENWKEKLSSENCIQINSYLDSAVMAHFGYEYL